MNAPKRCKIIDASSRVCERGTKSCEARHPVALSKDEEWTEAHDELHKMIQCSMFGWPDTNELSKAHQLLYKIKRIADASLASQRKQLEQETQCLDEMTAAAGAMNLECLAQRKQIEKLERQNYRLRMACELTLLFYTVGPWTDEKRSDWSEKMIAILGPAASRDPEVMGSNGDGTWDGARPSDEATTKNLCNAVRAALERKLEELGEKEAL